MLELDKQEITMQVGEKTTIEITKFSPSTPDDYTVKIISEDTDIVKIEDGS